jgi:hypothetical protein
MPSEGSLMSHMDYEPEFAKISDIINDIHLLTIFADLNCYTTHLHAVQ